MSDEAKEPFVLGVARADRANEKALHVLGARVNAIAALLERAKAEVAAVATADTMPAPIVEAYPEGAWVEFVFAGGSTFGRVEFVDGDWVHWRDGYGHAHASPRAALTCHWRPTR